MEAVFKVIVATIPKEFDGLEKALQIANDPDRDFELGDPEVSKKGILQDNEEECKSLLAWIGVEIDQHLDTLEYVEGVQFSRRSIRKTEYRRTFDEIAKQAYRVITGRPYPESVKIS